MANETEKVVADAVKESLGGKPMVFHANAALLVHVTEIRIFLGTGEGAIPIGEVKALPNE